MQSLRPVRSRDVPERADRRHLLIAVCAVIGSVVLASIDAFVSARLPGPAGSHLALNVVLNTMPAAPPFAFAVMGLIVVWRRAGNPVGWLMCAISFTYSAGIVTTDFRSRHRQTVNGPRTSTEAGLARSLLLSVFNPSFQL